MASHRLHPIGSAIIGYDEFPPKGPFLGRQLNDAGLNLVAACDPDPERLTKPATDFPGLHLYTSVDDLLDDPKVDVCLVTVPHHLRSEVAIQCLDAGKHVIVENPMCLSVADADAMITAAKESDRMLGVFPTRRYSDPFQTILKLIQEGVIGEVYHIEAYAGEFREPKATWRHDKATSGGALFHEGSRFLDCILRIMPEAVAGVDGYFQKRRWTQVTNDDHAEVGVRFASGKTARIEVSSLCAAQKPTWRILGTGGAITMQKLSMIEVTVDHHGHLATFKAPTFPPERSEYYANIAAVLMRGEVSLAQAEEARRVIAILEAAEQSSTAMATVVPACI